MDIFTYIPSASLSWASFIAVIIIGIASAINIIDRVMNQRRKEESLADDRLINLLKEQVSSLEKKLTELQKMLSDTQIRLETLIAENQTLREVLQGKDELTREFQRQGFEAIKRSNEILDIVIRTKEATK
jgi:uncharacterized protein YlxW (UPF0749 family)